MGILLNIIYGVLALAASPFILFRVVTSERWRTGMKQRLGFVPPRAGDKPCCWIHAVSVGETGAAAPLVELIERECPDWDVRISTTTNTGQSVARRRYGAERCFYFPLDLSFVVRRVFSRIRPDVIVLVELELWPNFLRVARALGVPVVVVNGRMREDKVARYRALRFLFGPAYDPASGNLFCVQNEVYRDRFERAGVPASMLRVTGNIKYDAVRFEHNPRRLAEMREAIGVSPDEKLWVAGCTWPGEEDICLRVHRELLVVSPGLRLVIAPRHIERADEVEKVIRRAGYACRRRSSEVPSTAQDTVILLDTIGELGYIYSLGEFVFVGKSLTSGGGHNMLEPAALGVTPVFGPMTDNFTNEAQLLLEAGAAECVKDESGLGRALVSLLRDESLRAERGRRGREVLQQCRGASRRNLEILRQCFSGRRCS